MTWAAPASSTASSTIFSRYIDCGFGLLHGEVAFIATTLIVIDVTLAALFWTWGEDDDIIARLIKKTLFVGVFAYIIGNWNSLAQIVFDSFAGLGLKAGGTGMSAADSPARPGRAGRHRCRQPLLNSISGPDGLRQLLRELPADRDPAGRLGDRGHRLLHPRDPAVRHPDRVQADDARGLRADPVRSVRQDRLPGRARAWQRRLRRASRCWCSRSSSASARPSSPSSPRAIPAHSRPSRMRWRMCSRALSCSASASSAPVCQRHRLGRAAARRRRRRRHRASGGRRRRWRVAGGRDGRWRRRQCRVQFARGTSRAAGGATHGLCLGLGREDRCSGCR